MLNNKNIKYKTKAIENFYSHHRIKWDQLYPSEKAVFESLAIKFDTSILDIGCGCGGLGLALAERFSAENYIGVDVSQAAIETAKQMNPGAKFISGDILEIGDGELPHNAFDVVVSLGCVDWNIEFEKMLNLAWSYVKPGGRLVSTFRLTNELEVEQKNAITKSYQYINFDGKLEGEVAPYVVFNANNLLSRVLSFSPKEVMAHGYWGMPSKSAITPYERICFSAFSIQKKLQSELYDEPVINLVLPNEILGK